VPPSPSKRWLQTIGTFPIVLLSWVLFRANSVHDAGHVYREIFTHFDRAHFFAGNLKHLAYGFTGIAILLAVELWTETGGYRRIWLPQAKPARWLAYAGLAMLIVLVGVFDGGQFIYFQF
jgi:hypothetical protein